MTLKQQKFPLISSMRSQKLTRLLIEWNLVNYAMSLNALATRLLKLLQDNFYAILALVFWCLYSGSIAMCFVAFLPDILDSNTQVRNKYLETLLSISEKFKRSPYSYV